jgi:hypothetical protein
MKIAVGTNVKWICKAGTLTGRVDTIQLDKNAADQTIPWLIVKNVVNQYGKALSSVMLPATDSYFAMMKLEVVQ